jgi:hypothetical protein
MELWLLERVAIFFNLVNLIILYERVEAYPSLTKLPFIKLSFQY